jgi:hypothetical protein
MDDKKEKINQELWLRYKHKALGNTPDLTEAFGKAVQSFIAKDGYSSDVVDAAVQDIPEMHREAVRSEIQHIIDYC